MKPYQNNPGAARPTTFSAPRSAWRAAFWAHILCEDCQKRLGYQRPQAPNTVGLQMCEHCGPKERCTMYRRPGT